MASYYAGGGDGWVGYFLADTWAEAYGASNGGNSNDAQAAYYAVLVSNASSGDIYRGFFSIDTSSIEDTATITAATFYFFYQFGGYADSSSVALVQTSQAAADALIAEDYDQVGSTRGATDIAISGMSGNSYVGWTLNATGISWIKKTAGDPYTKLGLRLSRDIDNVGFTTVGANDYIYGKYSENTGENADPYLDVEIQSFIYSRGAYSSLPAGTDDLTNTFTSGEYTQVATDDGDRVEQRGGV